MILLNEIEKSFPRLEKLFDSNTIKEFISCERSDLCIYYFGLGTWIRNNILLQGSKLHLALAQSGITHEDDMSYVIIENFYDFMRNKYKDY